MREDEAVEFKNKFEAFKVKVKNIPTTQSVRKLEAHPLYRIDGQWFFKTSYRKEYLKREYGIEEEDINSAKKEIEEILEFLKGFQPPIYYAILVMDGDEMGKWLKGEKMAKIEELIDGNAKNVLLKYSSGDDGEKLREKILCSRHPISASIHQGFSRGLTNFAIGRYGGE